jgi:hypothetical protein
MKNKVCELLVFMLLVGTSFIVTIDTVSADQDGDYTYTVSNGEATIIEYTGYGGVITVPSTLGGFPTVAIGNNSFQASYSLISVTLPNGITAIGNNAFQDCDSLTSVTFPNSITTIGSNAFRFCASLISVNVPSNVTTIGNYAFDSCNSLIAINVSTANMNYLSLDGVLYDKTITTLIQYPAGKSGTFTIPSSITTIGGYAFASCTNLTSVIIPNSVTAIRNAAFSNCLSLTSVTIPSSVTIIGDYVFTFCTSLTSMTIPDRVITIANNAFQGCTSLTSVTVGSGVTTIGDYTFDYCSNLTSITFLGLIAPTHVGSYWISGTPIEIRGHAYSNSNFPFPGGDFYGLTMGTTLSGTGNSENTPPFADFIWMPSSPKQNQIVIFNASASNDPDGYITLYEWDWNSDGRYEESDTSPIATHSWTQAGNYSVTLRVTDNNGSTNVKTITVSITNGSGTNNKGTPGFEIIFGLIAVLLVLFLKQKSKKQI